MKSGRDFLILSNNPLAAACLGDDYAVDYADVSSREILLRARDLIHLGHTLYTHPLSGSVKPNETPYKSVVVSRAAHAFSPEAEVLLSDAIAVFDKFPPKERNWSQSVLADFQLIDYTLLAGALDVDAAAGLSKRAPAQPLRPGGSSDAQNRS